MLQYEMKAMFKHSMLTPKLIGLALLYCLLAVSAEAQTSRIKRISLMTPDLDQSIFFYPSYWLHAQLRRHLTARWRAIFRVCI